MSSGPLRATKLSQIWGGPRRQPGRSPREGHPAGEPPDARTPRQSWLVPTHQAMTHAAPGSEYLVEDLGGVDGHDVHVSNYRIGQAVRIHPEQWWTSPKQPAHRRRVSESTGGDAGQVLIPGRPHKCSGDPVATGRTSVHRNLGRSPRRKSWSDASRTRRERTSLQNRWAGDPGPASSVPPGPMPSHAPKGSCGNSPSRIANRAASVREETPSFV
jgi:hypothetical protein